MSENLPNDIASCHQLIIQQQEMIASLIQQVADLTVEVARLKAQLNRNSRNSHEPPSQDRFRPTPKKPGLPKVEGKRNGGQPGHEGTTLKATATPDRQIELRPATCGCGADLSNVSGACIERRQVVDLPAMALEYAEYQRMQCQCPSCGERSSGEFPEGVSAPVQYGENIRTLGVILSVEYHLSLEKIATLFGDLFAAAMNQSTILSALEQSHQMVTPALDIIAQRIIDSEVVHADETGIRVAKQPQWLHTASTALYTFGFVHQRRGQVAIESEESPLGKCRHWLVHDCWPAYFLLTLADHALCGSHLLRELQGLIDSGSHWAVLMKRLLLAIYRTTSASDGLLPTADVDRAFRMYREILAQAEQQEPPPQPRPHGGRAPASKGRNLMRRLIKHESAVLAFALHPAVPFTNNQAERDIRPIKTKQKVSGAFRTLLGAQQYVRLHSFFSTARKNGVNAWKALRDLSRGESFLNKPTPAT